MLRFTVSLCCLCFLSLTPYLNAMSDEQKEMVHQHFQTLGMECLKDIAITEADIQALRSRQMPEGENVPCFLACIMKKTGLINDQGMLEKESMLDLARKVFDDEDELKNIEDFLHSCSSVNSVSVSDGAKGCERAMFAHKCMLDNAAQFGMDF